MRAGGGTRRGGWRRSWLVTAGVLAVLAAACTQDPASLAEGEAADPAVTEPSDEGAATGAVPTSDPDEASPREPASPSGAETGAEPAPTATPSPDEERPTPGPDDRAGPAPDDPVAGLEGLGEGAEGEAVSRLQQRLNELGYKVGPVDGAFGRRTGFAVRALQYDGDLPTSGVVDGATVAALQAATPSPVLEPGSSGDAVAQLQQRLNDGPFDVGAPDGEYGTRTAQGVYALQKLHGYPPDGKYSAVERYLEASGEHRKPRLVTGPEGRQGLLVEVDLSAQLVSVYRDGNLELAVHTSTGSGETFCTPQGGCRRAVTPAGSYTISRRIDGWRTSELGKLYNPLYFNGGIALHGAPSVPLGPASHGCVRLPMHIAEYAPDLLPNGTPVIVG